MPEQATDPHTSLPSWSLEAIAGRLLERHEEALERHDAIGAQHAAENALGIYRSLIARGDEGNAWKYGEWHVAAARMAMSLGDSFGAMELASAAGSERGLGSIDDRRLLADAARRAGDHETAVALAAEPLWLSPLVTGTVADTFQRSAADIIAEAARHAPDIAVSTLETALDCAMVALDRVETEELLDGVEEESRVPALRRGLAAGHQALARAQRFAGDDDGARRSTHAMQLLLEHESFGTGTRSQFRGAAMGPVERAFDSGGPVQGYASEDALADGFDGALARMFANILLAGEGSDGADDALRRAQEARSRAERLLAEDLADRFSGGVYDDDVATYVREAAEREASSHYFDALLRALPRATVEGASRLVDEGEIVLSISNVVGTPCLSEYDASRRWAEEVVAAEVRAGRPLDERALRAVLVAERSTDLGPGMETSPQDTHDLLERVVRDVAAAKGPDAVLAMVQTMRDDARFLRGPVAEPGWDRTEARVGEALLASGALEEGAATAMRREVLDHYGKAVAPDRGPGYLSNRAALRAWGRLVAAPDFQDLVPDAADALADRLAANGAVATVDGACLEIDLVRRVLASVEHLGDEGAGARSKLSEHARVVAEGVADPSEFDVVELVHRLVGAGIPDAASQLVAELEGTHAEALRGAVERATAVCVSDPTAAFDVVTWADAAGVARTGGGSIERSVVTMALRAAADRPSFIDAVVSQEVEPVGTGIPDWDSAATLLFELSDGAAAPDVLADGVLPPAPDVDVFDDELGEIAGERGRGRLARLGDLDAPEVDDRTRPDIDRDDLRDPGPDLDI